MDTLLEPDWSYYPYGVLWSFGFLFVYGYISPDVSGKYCKKYSELSAAVKVEWNARVMAIIMSVSIGCFYTFLMLRGERMYADDLWIGASGYKAMMTFLGGYTIADLFVIVWNVSLLGDTVFIFHHLAALVLICLGMTYHLPLDVAHFGVLLELSTPFVNVHWFLKTIRHPIYSKASITNGICLITTFFFARFASIPFLWYNVYRVHGCVFVQNIGYGWHMMLLCFVALNLLNSYWMFKLFFGLKKMHFKSS